MFFPRGLVSHSPKLDALFLTLVVNTIKIKFLRLNRDILHELFVSIFEFLVLIAYFTKDLSPINRLSLKNCRHRLCVKRISVDCNDWYNKIRCILKRKLTILLTRLCVIRMTPFYDFVLVEFLHPVL